MASSSSPTASTSTTRDGAVDDRPVDAPCHRQGLKVQGWQAILGKIDIHPGRSPTSSSRSAAHHALATRTWTSAATTPAANRPGSARRACATTVPTTMTVFEAWIAHSSGHLHEDGGRQPVTGCPGSGDTGIGIAAAGTTKPARTSPSRVGVYSASTGTLAFTFPDGATSTTRGIDSQRDDPFSGTSQPAGRPTASLRHAGHLRRRQRGELSGVYSTARPRSWARSLSPTSSTSAGLLRAGQNNFAATSASGAANIAQPGPAAAVR